MPNFKERGYHLQQSRCGIWQCFQLPVLLIDNCNLVLRQWLCHWSNCMLYMIVTLLAWLDLFLGCACMCPSSVYWTYCVTLHPNILVCFKDNKICLILILWQFWLCDTFRHARKYFNGVDEDQLSEVQHVMGLLAFSPQTEVESYKVNCNLMHRVASACQPLVWSKVLLVPTVMF